MFVRIVVFIIVAVVSLDAQGQSGNFPSNYTKPQAVPHGCLLSPPSLQPPPEVVFYDQTFSVEAPGGTTTVKIRVWRIGCHEPNRSVIALNLAVPAAPITALRTPAAFLVPDGSNDPRLATLSLFSAQDFPSAEQAAGGNLLHLISNAGFYPDGVTYIIQTIPPSISEEQYNDDIGLLLSFGPDPEGVDQLVLIPVFSYEPALDPTQLPLAAFHGRYSGQWTAESLLPASGLQLMIGEIPGSDRQFMFAIYFTYIDGYPTWVVGNPDFEVGANEVTMDMLFVEGGEFITQPGSYSADDLNVQVIGTMTLRAVHCNQIEADIDFTSSGRGATSLTFDRLVRVAGYDCDQTQ